MSLPKPQFVDIDPQRALRECIEFIEAHPHGRRVAPDQLERLIADLIVYRETLVLHQLQETGLQNLVLYSNFPMIDHLGGIVGAERVAAQPARTRELFSFAAPLAEPLFIAQGTRVSSKDRKVVFTTDLEVTAPEGAESATIPVTCTTAGVRGNGYAVGQISELLDSLSVAATVTNLDETSGGAASEDSERLRERIPGSVRGLSVAGPG